MAGGLAGAALAEKNGCGAAGGHGHHRTRPLTGPKPARLSPKP